jgi:hypothetical protein
VYYSFIEKLNHSTYLFASFGFTTQATVIISRKLDVREVAAFTKFFYHLTAKEVFFY